MLPPASPSSCSVCIPRSTLRWQQCLPACRGRGSSTEAGHCSPSGSRVEARALSELLANSVETDVLWWSPALVPSFPHWVSGTLRHHKIFLHGLVKNMNFTIFIKLSIKLHLKNKYLRNVKNTLHFCVLFHAAKDLDMHWGLAQVIAVVHILSSVEKPYKNSILVQKFK